MLPPDWPERRPRCLSAPPNISTVPRLEGGASPFAVFLPKVGLREFGQVWAGSAKSGPVFGQVWAGVAHAGRIPVPKSEPSMVRLRPSFDPYRADASQVLADIGPFDGPKSRLRRKPTQIWPK